MKQGFLGFSRNTLMKICCFSLLLLVLMSLFGTCYAQVFTWKLMGGPQRGFDQAVCVGNTVFALNKGRQQLLRSEDKGLHWSTASVNGEYNTVYDLKAYDTTLIIRTYMGNLLSRDKGATWESFTLRDNNTGWCFSRFGLLCCLDSTIYLSTDLGQQWTIFSTIPTQGKKYPWVQSIYAADSVVYICMYEGFYASYDEGKRWKAMQYNAKDILPSIINERGVFGRNFYCQSNSRMLYSGDYGATWKLLFTLDSIAGKYQGEYLLSLSGDTVTQYCTYAKNTAKGWETHVLAFSQNGTQRRELANTPMKSLQGIILTNEQGVLIGSASDGVFHSSDGGNSWIQVVDSLFYTKTALVAYDTVLYAFGDFVQQSNDSAHHWESILPKAGYHSLYVAGDSIYAGAIGYVVTSFNKAASYFIADVPHLSPIMQIIPYKNDIYCVSTNVSGQIFVSRDATHHSYNVESIFLGLEPITAYFLWNHDNRLYMYPMNHNKVLRFTGVAEQWEEFYNQPKRVHNFLATDRVLFLRDSNTVYRSYDKGMTWEGVVVAGSERINAIYYKGSLIIGRLSYPFDSNKPDDIVMSSDDGLTWMTIYKEQYLYEYSSICMIGKTVYISTRDGIYACTLPDSILSSVEEKSTKAHYQIFPQPANDILHIALSEKEQFLSLSITDMLGRTVLTLAAEAQQQSYNIDVSSLPAGMYLVHLHTSQAQTDKLISIMR